MAVYTSYEAHNSMGLQLCRTGECHPVALVYGHYPLPVIQQPETKPWASPAMGSTARQRADLLSVLTRHNVSAYVSGHLHGAFGQRVHRMHRTPTKGLFLL